MRTFELLLVFGEVVAIAWPAIFGSRPRRGIIAGMLLGLFAAQWLVEGLRWQMIPIYLAALGLAVGDLIVYERELEWTQRIARVIFGLAGLAVVIAVPVALPVPELPLPTGPVDVGTVTVEIVDIDRNEIYGETPGAPRKLNVQVWYPAQPEDDPVAPWAEDWPIVGSAVSRSMGLPGWFLSHTRYTEGHSYEGAPLLPGTYPVIIYSHGWTGFRSNAVNQIENLVSNGYIVIAADHTFSAVATVFEDGEVETYDPAALPDEAEVGVEAYESASQQLSEVYVADIEAILDELDRGEAGRFSMLSEIADTSRVGIYGHSVGGGAAVRVCLEDERCDAVLGMDPWVEPFPEEILAITPTKPAMYMRSDEWVGGENDALLRGLAGRSEAVSYWIGISGTTHSDFVATPLLSPYTYRFGLTGPIPAGRIVPIVDRYLVGFFDTFLTALGSAAIDSASFEEVSLEILRPDPQS